MSWLQITLARTQAVVAQLSGLLNQGAALWRQVAALAKEKRS